MSTRPQFDAEYIRDEFSRVAECLDGPLSIYLIGGGAMALRDLKESTKDIDLVVESSADHGRLWSCLSDAGYQKVQPLGEEYRQLGAESCVENEDGCRLDVFDRQVANKLRLSDGITDRSETFLGEAGLQVRLVSLEDIFLFKSVTGRADDVGDLNVLVQTGIDFDMVEAELRTQVKLQGETRFATYLTESLDTLEEEYNVTLQLRESVGDLVERHYDALAVWSLIEGPTSVETLRTELGLSEDELQQRLKTLERAGRIEREGETVFQLE